MAVEMERKERVPLLPLKGSESHLATASDASLGFLCLTNCTVFTSISRLISTVVLEWAKSE